MIRAQPFTLTVASTLALALPVQASSLAERQLAWIKDHDGHEIIAPDGSILVPLTAASQVIWLEPDGMPRDVGQIMRDPANGDVLVKWSEFGLERVISDPKSDAFPYEPTDRKSHLAETFSELTTKPLRRAVDKLPAGAILEPQGTIRLRSADSTVTDTLIGQWRFEGQSVAIALGDGPALSIRTADLLAAIEPAPD